MNCQKEEHDERLMDAEEVRKKLPNSRRNLKR
jgi:hypothetical protein